VPMLSQGRDRNLCAVCRHGDRAAIDFAIARGASSRTIETQYEIGRMTVQRHSATCLPAKVAVANAEREEKIEAAGLVSQMEALQDRCLALLDEAEASGTIGDRTKIIREARENIIAMGRLTGSIATSSANTTIDARTQIVSIAGMRDLTTDELRRLAGALPA